MLLRCALLFHLVRCLGIPLYQCVQPSLFMVVRCAEQSYFTGLKGPGQRHLSPRAVVQRRHRPLQLVLPPSTAARSHLLGLRPCPTKHPPPPAPQPLGASIHFLFLGSDTKTFAFQIFCISALCSDLVAGAPWMVVGKGGGFKNNCLLWGLGSPPALHGGLCGRWVPSCLLSCTAGPSCPVRVSILESEWGLRGAPRTGVWARGRASWRELDLSRVGGGTRIPLLRRCRDAQGRVDGGRPHCGMAKGVAASSSRFLSPLVGEVTVWRPGRSQNPR